MIVVLFYLIFLFNFISFIGVNLSLIDDINEEKRKEKEQKVRCEREVQCRAPPKSRERKTLKKKILSNAYQDFLLKGDFSAQLGICRLSLM